MSELISGKAAKSAWGGGEDVLYRSREDVWRNLNDTDFYSSIFNNDKYEFKLKPRTITITINNIEVPAPFEPKEGDDVWFISDDHLNGYSVIHGYELTEGFEFGAWRSESEIKQVVEALKKIFVINNQ